MHVLYAYYNVLKCYLKYVHKVKYKNDVCRNMQTHTEKKASLVVGPVAVAVASSCGGGDRRPPIEGGEALINT